MPQLKIASFNIEWMVGVFNGRWKDWNGEIPDSFPGRSLGDIDLEPIADVPALCERIANVVRAIDAKIIGIQEGPPRQDQLELFVERFLDDDYVVHSSNSRWQTLHALVHSSVANKVTAFAPDGPETAFLRGSGNFYPWGKIADADRKKHKFDRTPLVLTFQPSQNKKLRLIVVHTKSKYSKLKEPQQWFDRDEEAVLDALLARQKLSTEVLRLRQYVLSDAASPQGADALVVMGDLNDGPYAELIEQEFMIHNIVDELIGSFVEPEHFLKHAMTPAALATAATTRFPDPVQNGAIVEELIDHILVSPGIWFAADPFKLKSGSCKVEKQAYEDNFEDTGPVRQRGLRPSDHKPLSAIIEY